MLIYAETVVEGRFYFEKRLAKVSETWQRRHNPLRRLKRQPKICEGLQYRQSRVRQYNGVPSGGPLPQVKQSRISVVTYSPTTMDWQNYVKFQLTVRWYGKTMVANSGIHPGAETVYVYQGGSCQNTDGGLREGPPPQMQVSPPHQMQVRQEGKHIFHR